MLLIRRNIILFGLMALLGFTSCKNKPSEKKNKGEPGRIIAGDSSARIYFYADSFDDFSSAAMNRVESAFPIFGTDETYNALNMALSAGNIITTVIDPQNFNNNELNEILRLNPKIIIKSPEYSYTNILRLLKLIKDKNKVTIYADDLNIKDLTVLCGFGVKLKIGPGRNFNEVRQIVKYFKNRAKVYCTNYTYEQIEEIVESGSKIFIDNIDDWNKTIILSKKAGAKLTIIFNSNRLDFAENLLKNGSEIIVNLSNFDDSEALLRLIKKFPYKISMPLNKISSENADKLLISPCRLVYRNVETMTLGQN